MTAATSGPNWYQDQKNEVSCSASQTKILKTVQCQWAAISPKDFPQPKIGNCSQQLVKPGHRSFLTMIHETSAENIGLIQCNGVQPGHETGAIGYGTLYSGNQHIYAYAYPRESGPDFHAALFSTATWEQDPASEGVRLRGTAVPARDANSNTQTISITSIDRPLTPSTKKGMNKFYRAATGYKTDDNSGAQQLLNQFHSQFSGSSIPASAAEVVSVDPFAQFENQDMQGPIW